MRVRNQRRSNLQLNRLVFVVFFFISSVLLVIYFPPTYQIQIYQYKIHILYPFFASIFLFVYFLSNLALRGNRKHSLFIASFIIVYLLFRLNSLTQPLFLFLLIALFMTLEFLFTKKRNNKQEL